ncbi:hypothetical protein ACFVVQ_08935 [Paenibacillus chitinolyticus]|uniref:hypothetical protein n=1 Tax=Paenibacillus chitinolyticus TaxID=79263 RepID=UPI0036DB01B5
MKQLEAAQKEIGRPFEEEQKLQQFVARQSEINSVLELKELQDQEQFSGELTEENLSHDMGIDREY